MTDSPTLHFLGWDAAPLQLAEDWIAEHLGEDQSGVLIALPGGRAGRKLEERLARRLGRGFRPPRIVTAGQLTDELVRLRGVTASRTVRTLTWASALRELGPVGLRPLLAEAPEENDLGAWLALAAEARRLFGDVAAEGLRFETVAEDPELAQHPAEQRRWRVLAEAQERVERMLSSAGLEDPHLARMNALEARATSDIQRVVLVGVVEMNQLLRRALAITPASVDALVLAPADEREGFDRLGTLRAEAWAARDSALASEAWSAVDRPSDQAEEAAARIRGWGGEFAADAITIGVCDPALAPFVQRKLTDCGVAGRDAAGTPLAATGPVDLLRRAQRFLRTRSYLDLAALLRQPDLEARLRERTGGLDAVARADEYFDKHLPASAEGEWSPFGLGRDAERGPKLAGALGRVWRELEALLGRLGSRDALALPAWTEPVREFLAAVYGDEELDGANPAERRLLGALGKLGDALDELDATPDAVGMAGTADQALDLLLRELESQSLPPEAPPAGTPVIELLGWLELVLDDAPALVVTGFQDGIVPASVRGDAYLPDRLRRSLQLTSDTDRLARDLYATEVLVHSRRAHFVSGRRAHSGDPLRPSRILFQRPADEVVERMGRFVRTGATLRSRSGSESEKLQLPRDEDHLAEWTLESLSVTDFKLYLSSPYEYYLKRVLRLESLDDRKRELDAALFGNLAHEVLERFGRNEKVRRSLEPEVIERFLHGELRELARELLGARPLPAVRLQLLQLERRLSGFAEHQVRKRAEGWRIHAVEWAPAAGGVELEVDGEPVTIRGRIDRIDHRPESGEFALWDYKTGDKTGKPAGAHYGKAGWKDLQLPLYCLLAEELYRDALGGGLPQHYGYIRLGKDHEHTGFAGVDSWGGKKGTFESLDDGIHQAWEAARDVVRRIRNKEFFSVGKLGTWDPILPAIAGVGQVEGIEDDEEEGEA
jgi:ATP-dependent helicase/nuclease subunit B